VPQSRMRNSILVVDDNREFADAMREMLTRLGYVAIACNSPRDALRLVSFGPGMFDAAIVDEIMPDMRGTELAPELLRINDDMTLILVTGFGDLIPLEWVWAAGFSASLTKPVLKEELREVLTRLLGKAA